MNELKSLREIKVIVKMMSHSQGAQLTAGCELTVRTPFLLTSASLSAINSVSESKGSSLKMIFVTY